MSVPEIRAVVSKALWVLRAFGVPDQMARTQAEATLGELLESIDKEAPTVKDAKPFAIVDNNGGVEA